MPYLHRTILKDNHSKALDIIDGTKLWTKVFAYVSRHRARGVPVIDQQDADGRTPLHLLLDHPELANSLEIFDFLLKNGADTTITFDGLTPLHRAAAKGLIEYMDALVEYKVNVNAFPIGHKSDEYMTPLAITVESQQEEAFMWLLHNSKSRSNVEGRLPYSPEITILQRAVRKNNPRMVLALLEQKANPDAVSCGKNMKTVNALYYSLKDEHGPDYTCAHMLLQHNANYLLHDITDRVHYNYVLTDDMLLTARMLARGTNIQTTTPKLIFAAYDSEYTLFRELDLPVSAVDFNNRYVNKDSDRADSRSSGSVSTTSRSCSISPTSFASQTSPRAATPAPFEDTLDGVLNYHNTALLLLYKNTNSFRPIAPEPETISKDNKRLTFI